MKMRPAISAKCIVAVVLLGALPSMSQQTGDPLAEARSLLNLGKLAESEAALRKELVLFPASPDAHFLLGYVLFREKKAEESLAEFTAGAKYKRPAADELKVVASDYVLLKDFGDADKWFTEVVTEKPDDADTWYLLGRTKFNENDFQSAKSDFDHALALHPKYVEAENNIGLSWKELNNLEQAQAAFQTAIDWQGDAPRDEQPFLNLGTLLTGESEIDKAMPYLTKAVTLAPNNPKVHEELGQAYVTQQDLPKAQDELEKAVALAPDISALHFKLGQIYRREGLHDRAQQEFDICSKLNSTHSSPATPNPLTLGGPPSH
jgi:tetratricopeptide (TPR) repeat protein